MKEKENHRNEKSKNLDKPQIVKKRDSQKIEVN